MAAPLPTSTSGFSDALVILGAAGIVIPAFARFNITPIIGFILIGIIVGPFGLGALADAIPALNYVTISNPEAIEPFAELGIIMLLFSIGLELSFRRLWTMRRVVFAVGAAELLASAALIGLGLFLFGSSVAAAIALGLALALSSTAIVLPLVGTHGAVGRSALGMLLFEDVALVPIVFALGAIAPAAGGASVGSLATSMLLGGAVAVALLLGGRLVLPRLFAQAARTKNPELFLAACLVVIIVSSLATSAVGFSAVLGRADRGHRHRRDRISRRGRGHHGADPRARPRHLPHYGGHERRPRLRRRAMAGPARRAPRRFGGEGHS